jgi:hypothetical protein
LNSWARCGRLQLEILSTERAIRWQNGIERSWPGWIRWRLPATQITEKDIRTIERYLKTFQRFVIGGSTWDDIRTFASPYATSIVIHELIEIRLLEAEGIRTLKLSTEELQETLSKNIEAHNTATYEEHLYLREYIQRQYQVYFEVATLIRANRGDDRDRQLFLESEVGVYILEEERVPEAEAIMVQVKGESP